MPQGSRFTAGRWTAASVLALGVAVSSAGFAPPLAFAQDAAESVTDAAPLMSPEEVMRLSDEGVALARAGDFDKSFDLIAKANDATFETDDYDALVKHYPNLAFARYYMLSEDYDEVERFAASVASALVLDGYPDHPYRIEASILNGVALFENWRSRPAEGALRKGLDDTEGVPELADIREMALYYLATMASIEHMPDAAALRVEFLQNWDGSGWIDGAQAVGLLYRHLQNERVDNGVTDELIGATRQLISMAEAIEDLPEERVMLYRSFLALVLDDNGDRAEARALFDEQIAYYARTEDYDDNFEWTMRASALNQFWLGQEQEAYDFLAETHALLLAELGETEDSYRIPYLMGQIDDYWGNADVAQGHFREAYTLIRKFRRANDETVRTIAGKLDTDAPEMANFAFSNELGVIGENGFALEPDAQGVVEMFFAGNYNSLGIILQRYVTNGEAAGPEYALNAALYYAFIGEYDMAQTRIDRARRDARTTAGAKVSANSPYFDLVDLVAKLWGSSADIENADDPLARLLRRADRLEPSERSLLLAMDAFYSYRLYTADTVDKLYRWVDDFEANPDRPTNAWDLFAALSVLEIAMGQLPPDDAAKVLAYTQKTLAQYPELTLAQDYVRLVEIINGPALVMTDEGLSELGVLVRSISEQVPEYHSMIAATEYGLYNAFRWRGDSDSALVWLRRATETLRAHPFHDTETMALLLSQEGLMLSAMGEVTQGAAVAKQAYDMVDLTMPQSERIAAVVEAYAYAVSQRSENNWTKAAKIYEQHLNDPVYYAGLLPLTRVRQLSAYADYLKNYAEVDEVLAVLDKAAAELEGYPLDVRQDVSNLHFQRAITEYWGGDLADAYTEMALSVDVISGWRDEKIANGAGAEFEMSTIMNRVSWEAFIGWDLAQQMQAQPTPDQTAQ